MDQLVKGWFAASIFIFIVSLAMVLHSGCDVVVALV